MVSQLQLQASIPTHVAGGACHMCTVDEDFTLLHTQHLQQWLLCPLTSLMEQPLAFRDVSERQQVSANTSSSSPKLSLPLRGDEEMYLDVYARVSMLCVCRSMRLRGQPAFVPTLLCAAPTCKRRCMSAHWHPA